GKCNFRGSRKSTAYAAQVVAQDAARNAMAHGLKDVVIRVSGPGLGRDSAIRALQAIGLEITSIVDVTPIPHNGCRPRKRRRVYSDRRPVTSLNTSSLFPNGSLYRPYYPHQPSLWPT